MLKYNPRLKQQAQTLRKSMTEAELNLWRHLRRKQIQGVQFYRQTCIGNYIVDFYAPTAKLVIEVDGAQHFEHQHEVKDRQRDAFLASQRLTVLRFHNGQVLQETENVIEAIYQHVTSQLASSSSELKT